MTNLSEEVLNQILLIAPDLLGETLSAQIKASGLNLDVKTEPDELSRTPSLVIWSVDSLDMPATIQIELKRLQNYWDPSPVLILLPPKIRLETSQVLQFNSPGVLQDPDLKTLMDSISSLIKGGRVLRLKDYDIESNPIPTERDISLASWLLISGIRQITSELAKIDLILKESKYSPIELIVINGRRRELKASQALLFWIWGGNSTEYVYKRNLRTRNRKAIGLQTNSINQDNFTNINLSDRTSQSVWNSISKRVKYAIQAGLTNSTDSVLAIEGLNQLRQSELLVSLIEQLDTILTAFHDSSEKKKSALDDWENLQVEIRREALRRISGSYTKVDLKGVPTTVADKILSLSDLTSIDEELPNSKTILEPLLFNKPVIIDGQILPVDDPRSVLHLELYITNWLIRSAEIISSEVLQICGEWPELRRLFLDDSLVSTRELERLRNRINSQNRWRTLVDRPIQLYESRRILFKINRGEIETCSIMEPRDEELRSLGWWQQQVALLVETRDALAPQIQSVIKRVGDLMVVILTQVLGRAIGLIGRGIVQGMGRTLGKG